MKVAILLRQWLDNPTFVTCVLEVGELSPREVGKKLDQQRGSFIEQFPEFATAQWFTVFATVKQPHEIPFKF